MIPVPMELRTMTVVIGVEIHDHIAVGPGIPIAETLMIRLRTTHLILTTRITILALDVRDDADFEDLALRDDDLELDAMSVHVMNFGKFMTGIVTTRRDLHVSPSMYETYINAIID